MVMLEYFFMIHVHQCILFFQIGKGEPKAKQVKLAQKARKPQAAKNGPKKPFPCDQCEKSYDSPTKLKMHIDSVHLGIRHKCTLCDEDFSQKGHLNRHIKGAHENAFVCKDCNEEFASNHGLKAHVASTHEGIRHKCNFCDKTFARTYDVTRHVKSQHQNE